MSFEKVNPCHPDKVADRIAGAIVDLAYSKNNNPNQTTAEPSENGGTNPGGGSNNEEIG